MRAPQNGVANGGKAVLQSLSRVFCSTECQQRSFPQNAKVNNGRAPATSRWLAQSEADAQGCSSATADCESAVVAAHPPGEHERPCFSPESVTSGPSAAMRQLSLLDSLTLAHHRLCFFRSLKITEFASSGPSHECWANMHSDRRTPSSTFIS